MIQSLTVLDYLLHAGSENVVIYFKDNIYIIKTLKEFQYVDEYGKDQGANVRQKAKDITNLLQDDSRLRHERRSRAHMRDRMLGEESGPTSRPSDDENQSRRSPTIDPARTQQNRDDDELQRAIEASKRSLAEEQARGAEDRDLERAIRLSQEDEAKRSQALLDANGQALFDDQQQMYASRPLIIARDSRLSHLVTPVTIRTFSLTRSLLVAVCNRSSLRFNLSLLRLTHINSKLSRRLLRFVACASNYV